jgi:hypothetical protein
MMKISEIKLEKICGLKRKNITRNLGKLQNEELHNLYSSSDNVKVKSGSDGRSM